MKFFRNLFFLISVLSQSTFIYSQCFNCGFNIGNHTDDRPQDLDLLSDGVLLTTAYYGNGEIHKYDFNCNLVWTYNFENEYDFIQITKTAVDANDNIYAIIDNSQGTTNVGGIEISEGLSLVKISSNGGLLWVRPIGSWMMGINLHIWNDKIYVVGHFESTININNEFILNSQAEDYYIAVFNPNGNFLDARRFGETLDDVLIDSEMDHNGNIYITGRSRSTYVYSHITKIDPELNFIWVTEISNDSSSINILNPSNLYYNKTNNRLYLWGSFNGSIKIGGQELIGYDNFFRTNMLIELSAETGNIERIKLFENKSTLPMPSIGGNWLTNNINTGRMFHSNNELIVLTSFQDSFTLDNVTIMSAFGGNYYHEDLVLFKVKLDDFSSEFILKTTGESYFDNPDATYQDGPGPILIHNNNIYVTSFFESSPISIDNTTIPNNSGNNDSDVLFYKYSLLEDNQYSIGFNRTCFGEGTEFFIDGDFDSVEWNFGDILSASNNLSNEISPIHVFTNPGQYLVKANIICGEDSQEIEIEVMISEPPVIYYVEPLYSCEDTFNTGISNTFDVSFIEEKLVGSQSNLTVSYFDLEGNPLPSPLPNPMANSVRDIETITVRVSREGNLGCYAESTFDLIVNSLPVTKVINDLYSCDDDNDGIGFFDVSHLETELKSGQEDILIQFFYEDGEQLPVPLPNTISNKLVNQETITARIINPNTSCFSETTFRLVVNPLPQVYPIEGIIGCDDNNDGISEYFDTSNVESTILGGQTGMEVSYYDVSGNLISKPLDNPYTNSNPFQETLIARVTNVQTSCYVDTPLILKTSAKPQISTPVDKYSCDKGDGFSDFNLENIKNEIIGNQTDITLHYFDSAGNDISNLINSNYTNQEPWNQTIFVRAENSLNNLCYSETSFDLIVNTLPQVQLDDSYFLCDLEQSYNLVIENKYDTFLWTYQDGSVISNNNEAILISEGGYSLTVGRFQNGIMCENRFNFELIRSILPSINDIEYQELSDSNFIRIIAAGDGDFEYSLDGINYQDNNSFDNLQGGVYTVRVRDKFGCGEDSTQVIIVDYPKYFTPNGDGINDTWFIAGLSDQFQARSDIFIYDRYGKLLKQLSPSSIGWDGTFNGSMLPSDDYWFSVSLEDGRTFKGHFTLKR
ncbi:T9SS type B sorting domain-containing protein [Gaetbulibacter sp. M240]|uniref:T9SS type B sorting domain-containing protein n=1 Tax=Gaetbulibacter sp. M240 TaxID=3126511 RepID=UPI00374EB8F4